MGVSSRYIAHQGPVLATLANTAIGMVKQQLHGVSSAPLQAPGPVFTGRPKPLPSDLIDTYIQSVGGERGWYKGNVPAHLLPQWGFPLSSKTLENAPYPMATVLNGGFRLEINGDLPRGERLVASAQLTNIEEKESLVVMDQRLTTGTESNPEAVVSYFYPVVPRKSKDKSRKKGPKKRKAFVPEHAREIARLKISKSDALDFAKLTGDFNPVHWIDGYAKSMGFKGVFLHGFAQAAWTIEALNKNIFFGDVSRLETFDCRFTRQLYLPADPAVFVDDDNNLWLGESLGGPAYLQGSFSYR